MRQLTVERIMRYCRSGFFVIMVGAAAVSAAVEPDTTDDIQVRKHPVVDKSTSAGEESKTDLVELGERIVVRVSGRLGGTLADRFKKGPQTMTAGVKLYINGVYMAGLRPAMQPASAFEAGDKSASKTSGADCAAKPAAAKEMSGKARENTDKAKEKADKSKKKLKETEKKSGDADKKTSGPKGEASDANAAPADAVDSACKTIVLLFTLERDANNKENRDAWDTLFRQCESFDQKLQIGVGVDGELPHLSVPGAVRFRVRSGGIVVTVVLGGIAAFALILYWAAKTSMLREDGVDSGYSLGKTQMAIWGTLVLVCFFGVWIVSQHLERIPPGVLILLGISGTTALGAVLISGSKRAEAGDEIKALDTKKDDLTKLRAGIEAGIKSLEAERSSAPSAFAADRKKKLDDMGAQLTRIDAMERQRNELQKKAQPGASLSPADEKRLADLDAEIFRRPAINAAISSLVAEKPPGDDGFPPEKARKLGELQGQLVSTDAQLTEVNTQRKPAENEARAAHRTKSFLNDIITDPNGKPNFHRLQVVLWTLILGVVFLHTVLTTFTMPEFDATLLALMGISNGTYLGFKFPEKADKNVPDPKAPPVKAGGA